MPKGTNYSKEGQAKPKVHRRKEMIKIRVKINKLEIRKTVGEKNNEIRTIYLKR